ncbi:protein ADM2a [Echeneis naucrates]|uniref:Adrenomedullin 2b n=1 Tax=Echeneis naucrates TaxID=173247 RepID=A0A665W6V8_ECHNA|nr:protein ADM2 [Echeneis naucrates]XP_029351155.1 protein ADM2 [Echeneis naucrates]
MRYLLPLAVYCISLVSVQRLQALPVEERPGSNRLDLISQPEKEDNAVASVSQPNTAVSSSVPSPSPKWLPSFLSPQPASGVRLASQGPAWLARVLQLKKRPLRVRRHAHLRGGHHYPHHAQLMRVGCVLGTCQVQNLSHRLYQLIGQSGREDSSPINPRSPHSYG